VNNLDIFKLAAAFERLAQAVGLQAADIQVALGQDEFGNPASGKDYYSQNTINNIITDFCNKYNVSDNVKGEVNINYQSGSISFIVNLSDEQQKAPMIADYLKSKFVLDMTKKISESLKNKHKSPIGNIVASWIKF
jgi:hypothetical protein